MQDTLIGAIGDVHTEDRLLASALETLQAMGIPRIICVGDLLDGSGDLNRCVELLQHAQATVVRGNHERWLFEGTVRSFPDATHESEISPASRTYLQALPSVQTLSTSEGDVLVCHGIGEQDMPAVEPEHPAYLDWARRQLVRQNLPVPRILIQGHTHRRLVLNAGGFSILNAGTLKADEDPCFVVINLIARQATFYEPRPGQSPLERETRPLA